MTPLRLSAAAAAVAGEIGRGRGRRGLGGPLLGADGRSRVRVEVWGSLWFSGFLRGSSAIMILPAQGSQAQMLFDRAFSRGLVA
jgi:hypothetical protein